MKSSNTVELNQRVEGYYRVQKSFPGEEPHYDSGYFRNLITDLGLDQIGNSVVSLAFCHVGTGNATPAFSNTQLSSFLASQAITTTSAGVNNVSGNYYGWVRNIYTFAQGAAAGNLAELGVSPQSGNGQLFSRALILDGSGNPTTLTVLSNEILTVTYEYRMLYSETDVTSSIVISGTTYSLAIRPADVTNAAWWSTYLPGGWGGANNSWLGIGSKEANTLAALTATSTSGGYSNQLNMTDVAYVSGNHYRERSILTTITQWNYATGVGAIFYQSGVSAWQIAFTPKIPKDNTKTLQLRVRWTWARA